MEEIVNRIIEKLEETNSILWPTAWNSKLTKEKFIVGFHESLKDDIELYEAFGYKYRNHFSMAINKIIHIKDKPQRVEWKHYLLKIIDLKICPKCKKIKPIDSFKKDCYCKQCKSNNGKRQRKETRQHILTKYFNCECSICGYKDNLSSLELHHIDNNIERPKWAISKSPSNYLFNGCSIETAEIRIKEELTNLQLLCHNCHSIKHATSSRDRQKGLKEALLELEHKYECSNIYCDEHKHLQLHHNNPKEKHVSFSTFQNMSRETILKDGLLEVEMKKDVLILCGNHHREIHHKTGEII